ncbi:helix-turn-helix transcriptional regulator [Kitasatospora sp. NPDC049258]|uniref:helix-turn-helix domain-containing protein n=1 Tax=Kitasatospora sp. NPDC049258 TaxID=3155394 RepID=UPI0034155FBD
MTTASAAPVDGPAVGTLLRGWRERRRISQLELALKADSSARHISFVETGRSRPSRAMVLRLAEHLDVPVRERNTLLVAAGYAPAFTETPLRDPAMVTLRTGLERLLAAHEPNPALVLDGGYDVVTANRAVGFLLDGVAEHLLRPPMNAIRLTLHPQGLAPRIHNLREWRAHLLERMRTQLAMRPGAALRRLYEEAAAFPLPTGRADGRAAGRPDGGSDAGSAAEHPAELYPYALPLRIEAGGRLLSFLSTVTTFNSPMDVTVSELAVETFLPADAPTAEALRRLAGHRDLRPPGAGPGSR